MTKVRNMGQRKKKSFFNSDLGQATERKKCLVFSDENISSRAYLLVGYQILC